MIDISLKKKLVSKLNMFRTIADPLTAYLIKNKSNSLSNKIKLYKRLQDKNVTIDIEKNFSINDNSSNLFFMFFISKR